MANPYGATIYNPGQIPDKFSIPGEDAFYSKLTANALRGVYSGLPGARNSYLDAMDARGLGQSTIASGGLSALLGAYGNAAQQAVSQVQQDQWRAREQRVAAYQQYLYQKALQQKNPLDYLFDIGTALPFGINDLAKFFKKSPGGGSQGIDSMPWDNPYDRGLPPGQNMDPSYGWQT